MTKTSAGFWACVVVGVSTSGAAVVMPVSLLVDRFTLKRRATARHPHRPLGMTVALNSITHFGRRRGHPLRRRWTGRDFLRFFYVGKEAEMADRPVFIFVGAYDSEDGAQADYDVVKELHKAGAVGSFDAAVITKDEQGKVHVNKDET